MIEIRVINMKSVARGEYIGRPSPLGNPFVIGRHGGRETVIAKYDTWLTARLGDPGSPQDIEFRRLANIARRQGYLNLSCFCAPKPCHGDIIKEKLEYFLTKDSNHEKQDSN